MEIQRYYGWRDGDGILCSDCNESDTHWIVHTDHGPKLWLCKLCLRNFHKIAEKAILLLENIDETNPKGERLKKEIQEYQIELRDRLETLDASEQNVSERDADWIEKMLVVEGTWSPRQCETIEAILNRYGG